MATYGGSDKRIAYLFTNGGGGASALTDLSDVDLSSPSDGQALIYDGANQKWINGSVSGGGGGVTVIEEVLNSTETTISAWANPLSIPLSLNNYAGFGVEVTWNAGSSPISYFVTAGQISGNSYVLIPWYQGNKTHNDLYIGYSNGNLNFYVETTYSVTIHRVTGLRKADAYSHIYSTTEQIVGTWIDGKPIYEITIPTGSLPNNSAISLTTPSNIGYVIEYSGFVYNTSDSTHQRPLPLSAGGSSDIRLDLNSGTLRITTYSNWNNYEGYVTVKYTKSTD